MTVPPHPFQPRLEHAFTVSIDHRSVGSTISQTMARNLPLTDPARGAEEDGVRRGMMAGF